MLEATVNTVSYTSDENTSFVKLAAHLSAARKLEEESALHISQFSEPKN